jgi:hypothetical protein
VEQTHPNGRKRDRTLLDMAGKHRRRQRGERRGPGRQSPLRTPILRALGLGLAIVGPAVARTPPTMLALSGPDGPPPTAAPTGGPTTGPATVPATEPADGPATGPAGGPATPDADLPAQDDPGAVASSGAEQR